MAWSCQEKLSILAQGAGSSGILSKSQTGEYQKQEKLSNTYKKMTVIDEIVSRTYADLSIRKAKIPQELFDVSRKPLSLKAAILGARKRGNAVISEIKPSSPSLGAIKQADPAETAKQMLAGGACAISVLTEPHYFSGSLLNLELVRKAVDIPLLRKDFIIDEYQIYEAKHYGADAVLLMVSVLGDSTNQFLDIVHLLGMEALVEVHDEDELAIALKTGAKVIGINNRSLRDLSIDLSTTQRLVAKIPPAKIKVSESGVKSREDLNKVISYGADAVLIGSSIMQSDDVEYTVKQLIKSK
jgi:indole-3-glycerol phosphate synthase